jgi:Fur family peroxide stress response transcriptional regulator
VRFVQTKESSAMLLIEKGIRPSYTRIRIYDYLREKRNHPTVEDIYAELVQSIPTLSRTTVYNTLSLFLQNHLLQLVTIEENGLRYDADTSCHGHFKCLNCGKIFDFSADAQALDAKDLEGFDIMQKSVYFIGKCKNCKET